MQKREFKDAKLGYQVPPGERMNYVPAVGTGQPRMDIFASVLIQLQVEGTF